MCTPYQWTKQVASHWGGTRNGTIVHWPAGIAAKGEVRDQFHHVIDIAPTVLDAAGLPEPTFVHGVQQLPYEGVSMRYAFADASAAGRHETQYFEMFCNRGIYHNGWTAVTRHSVPWDITAPMPPLLEDKWELYSDTDWTQAHDLSAEMPEKLAALQQLWLIEVSKYNVLPLDDRRVERFNSDLAGRPTLIKGTQQILFNGMRQAQRELGAEPEEQVAHRSRRRSSSPSDASGVIVAQGGEFGGWSLYLVDGKPRYCYNMFGASAVPCRWRRDRCRRARIRSASSSLTTAVASRRAAPSAIYVDGSKVGEGRVEGTVPMLFSADETLDLGSDTGSPVSDEYTSATSHFTGTVSWVQLDIADDDSDHFITAEERMKVAMARQ